MAFNLYGFAWKHAHRVPAPLYRGLLTAVADMTWLTKTGGVAQLSKNLVRVRPDLSATELSRLTRAGMRSYMRYFGEAFVLTQASPEQITARVRTANAEPVLAAIAQGRSPILALGHQGNWDLAGVWATPHLAPVLTVAERLKPDEVFQEFLAYRNKLGMRILAAGDPGVFRDLLRAAGKPGSLIALLGDRDLSRSGIEVDLFGHRARVAAGPAALAVGSGAPLFGLGIYYERLTGERRKAAGSPWGIVMDFSPEIQVDRTLPKEDQVAATTQAWVDQVAVHLARHPQDWHMLQKVFIADLDPARYAASIASTESRTDGAA